MSPDQDEESAAVVTSESREANASVSQLGSLCLCILVISIQLAILSLSISYPELNSNVAGVLVFSQFLLIPLASFLAFRSFRSRVAAGVFSTLSSVIWFVSAILFFFQTCLAVTCW